MLSWRMSLCKAKLIICLQNDILKTGNMGFEIITWKLGVVCAKYAYVCNCLWLSCLCKTSVCSVLK